MYSFLIQWEKNTKTKGEVIKINEECGRERERERRGVEEGERKNWGRLIYKGGKMKGFGFLKIEMEGSLTYGSCSKKLCKNDTKHAFLNPK